MHVCVEIANSHGKKIHLHFNDKVQFISGHETLLQETLRFFPHNTGFHGCLISADHYSMLMLLIISAMISKPAHHRDELSLMLMEWTARIYFPLFSTGFVGW